MTTFKTIILSIIGLALVSALWFWLYTSHEKDMRLINAQETHTKYNDSLDYLVRMRELQVDTLMFRKQEQKEFRVQSVENTKRKLDEARATSYTQDQEFNIDFLNNLKEY